MQTRTHDATHELTAITGIGPNVGSLSYDPKGNMTENSNGQDYTWDFDNQLEEATVPTGSGIGIVGTHEYTYDALGRRVSKAVGGASPQTLVFVCSGAQVIAEYISGAAAANAQRKYVHASTIDERCLMIDRTALGVLGAGAEEFFYYHTNNLYSVAALTNAAGAPVERYAYDPYGNPIILDALGLSVLPLPATGNPHLYTGRRLDDETGLYYYRARYYDAALGRFIGRDPIEYDDGLNLYSYVGNSPTNAVDPDGLKTRAYWEQQARNAIGYAPGTASHPKDIFEMNRRITAAYAQMYLSDPSRFLWAGMAALASQDVGTGMRKAKGLRDAGGTFFVAIIALCTNAPTGAEMQRALAKGNLGVYADIYWQHLAYMNGGISEMKSLMDRGELSAELYESWKQIDDGKAWEGNRGLLKYEQSVTLQAAVYDPHAKAFSKMSWMSSYMPSLLSSPIPGDSNAFQSVVPDGDLGDLNDRWKWIDTSMLPAWKQFATNSPDEVRRMMKEFAQHAYTGE